MGMGRRVINIIIGIVVVFSILAGTVGLAITSANTVENTANIPDVLVTFANLWYIPVLLALVGVIVSTGSGRRGIRRMRRRWRR